MPVCLIVGENASGPASLHGRYLSIASYSAKRGNLGNYGMRLNELPRNLD